MKTTIKKLFLGVYALPILVQAQQVPTITNPPNGGQNSGDFWSRSGNANTGGINNIFGII